MSKQVKSSAEINKQNKRDYMKNHYIDSDGKYHKIQNTDVKGYLDSNGGFNSITKILALVLTLLLVVALMRTVLGAEPVYFSSFLEMLTDVPTVNLMVSIKDLTITADWGLFNFFRDMLNVSGSIISVLTFVFSGLLNIAIYILYFVRYLFAV